MPLNVPGIIYDIESEGSNAPKSKRHKVQTYYVRAISSAVLYDGGVNRSIHSHLFRLKYTTITMRIVPITNQTAG